MMPQLGPRNKSIIITMIMLIIYSRDALDQMDQVFGIFYEVPNTGTKEMKDDNNYPAKVMPLVRGF